MIPEFPEFKNLELSDKEEIEDLTRQFPPYSNFYFISIYCWDIDNNTLISKLNENLIIKQTDCLSYKQFLSFIGVNSIPETIFKISEFLKENKRSITFRWVPEVTVNHLNGFKAAIVEDRDHFDYIYNVSDFYTATGREYKMYRQNFNRFTRNYPNIIASLLDLTSIDVKTQICNLFNSWAEKKELENKNCEPSYENKALNKLLSSAHSFETLFALGVFDGTEIIAFSIIDIPDKEYASILFGKSNICFKNSFQYMMKETISLLYTQGIKFVSLEEDLGIESLKEAKLHYNLSFFLKKYKIEICN